MSTRNPRWWLTTSQDSNHTRNPSRARYSDRRRPETYARYSDRTRPDTYGATVSPRTPRWWLPTNHCRTRYSDRTRPEAYGATVSTQNPRWWLTTSQDSNHTRYSDRTRPEAYVTTVIARVPMRTLLQWSRVSRDVRCYIVDTKPDMVAHDISGFQSHSHPETRSLRSEERRVGKECRSRWSPYH